jgi:hypothetical protein
MVRAEPMVAWLGPLLLRLQTGQNLNVYPDDVAFQ